MTTETTETAETRAGCEATWVSADTVRTDGPYRQHRCGKDDPNHTGRCVCRYACWRTR